MKHIVYLIFAVAILAACKKDKKSDPTPEPEPMPVSIYGEWNLYVTAKPFSADTTWKYPKWPEENNTLYLMNNGKYLSRKYPDITVEGTFTVTDSANTDIKIVTISNQGEPIKWYLRVLSNTQLQMDDETIKASDIGYTSRKFSRNVECIVRLN